MTTITPAKEKASDSVDTREWFDVPYHVAQSVALPEPNEDYLYCATRLLSWYPVVNDRGATYEPSDFDDDLLKTLLGKQVNLEHDVTKVVGTIFGYQQTDEGIDIGIEINREQANIHGLDPEDLKSGNYFSTVSLELTPDVMNSTFYAYDDGFNVMKRIPAVAAHAQGIRRTRASDPYKLQGLRVAERIKPKRFTGVGFVPNPSDKTAKLFKVRADSESEEVQVPPTVADQTPPNVAPEIDAAKETAAAKEQLLMDEKAAQELKDAVARLESQVKTLTTEKETASAEVSTANAKIADLEAQIAAKVTELAASATELETVKTERDALKSEKEVAARESRISALVAELEALHASVDDAAKDALKEKASAAVDNDSAVATLKLERQLEAANAKIAALAVTKEKAAAEGGFDPITPTAGFRPEGVKIVNGVKSGPMSKDDVLAAF